MIYYLRTGRSSDCQYLSRRIEAENDDEALASALVTIALYPYRYYALYDGDWEKVAYYSPDGTQPSASVPAETRHVDGLLDTGDAAGQSDTDGTVPLPDA